MVLEKLESVSLGPTSHSAARMSAQQLGIFFAILADVSLETRGAVVPFESCSERFGIGTSAVSLLVEWCGFEDKFPRKRTTEPSIGLVYGQVYTK